MFKKAEGLEPGPHHLHTSKKCAQIFISMFILSMFGSSTVVIELKCGFLLLLQSNYAMFVWCLRLG